MLRKLLCLAVLVAATPNLVSAQVKLEQKYPEGAVSTTETEATTNQTLVLAGMNVETKSQTFAVGSSTVGKRAADGSLEIVEKTESFQSEISLPGGLAISFDSSNPDKKASNPLLEPIVDSLRAITKNPITLKLDANNKLVGASLPEGEYEKLTGMAKDQLSPEWLKKGIERHMAHLPSEAVKVGDKWEYSHEVNPGEGQVLTFRTQYEYAGTVEKDGKTLDKITSKVLDVTFAINGNPMLQVKNCELKVQDSSGTCLFDRKLGNTVSRASKTQIVGPLTLVINNMEFPGSLDLTMEEKVANKRK